jgi:hypothetical protein
MICGRKYFRFLKVTKNTFLWFEIFDVEEKKVNLKFFSIFAIFLEHGQEVKI